MSKYQITHYWSDENTFPETIETYTLNAKNEDNIIKRILKQQDKDIRKAIDTNMSFDPITIGLDLVYDEYTNSFSKTLSQFQKENPDIDLSDDSAENYPAIRFYGWTIAEVENN